MHGLFALAGLAGSRMAQQSSSEAIRKSSRAAAKVSTLQQRLRMVEDNLAKALMINEALWEFIRDKHGLTENDLNEKLYAIDMRDGQLDGKNQRSGSAPCPKCNRAVSARHSTCIYCGQIIDDSVFQIT